MRRLAIISAALIAATACAFADNQSDDPLLDARINLVVLHLKYTDGHPKIIAAKAALDVLSGATPESPIDYRKHIQERITLAESEDAAAKLKYTDLHPVRVRIIAKLKYLQQLFQDSDNSETANSNPGLLQQVP